MIFNLSFNIPNDLPLEEIKAYIAEQTENLNDQLKYDIIQLPAVDVSIYIDFDDTQEALFYRSG